MRVCAGKYKGRKLLFGDTFDHVRPTKDRVKESIYLICWQINVKEPYV